MIIPHEISIGEWAGNLYIDFPVSFQVSDVSEDNWKEFARQVNRINEISVNNPPEPEGFDNWRDWASRLLETNF